MYCYETWLTTKREEIINYKHLTEKCKSLYLTSILTNMNENLILGRFLIRYLYENILLKKTKPSDESHIILKSNKKNISKKTKNINTLRAKLGQN